MTDSEELKAWFVTNVLPLEAALTRFLNRNWRVNGDIVDLRQDVYASVLKGAAQELPANTAAYVFTIARNLLINRTKRARVVSFHQMSDLDDANAYQDLLATERHLDARDALRLASAGLEALPPRCREVVRLRKLEGLSTIEAAKRMGVSVDTIERQLTLGVRAMADATLGGSGRIDRTPSARSAWRKWR